MTYYNLPIYIHIYIYGYMDIWLCWIIFNDGHYTHHWILMLLFKKLGITDYTLCIHHLMDTYGFDSYGYYLMEITGTGCDQDVGVCLNLRWPWVTPSIWAPAVRWPYELIGNMMDISINFHIMTSQWIPCCSPKCEERTSW